MPVKLIVNFLPDKSRKGYFIGDGTGVGKGREIASILWDNWNQGRHKAIWLSQNSPLMKDAQRDIAGVGWNKNLIFDIGKQSYRKASKKKKVSDLSAMERSALKRSFQGKRSADLTS